ncbi:MAG: hypothetical protein C4330_10380 [Chitinophagaceae bacterium]
MKIKILSAFAIAIFVFPSCNWLKQKTNPLVGSWKIDSLNITKDSNSIVYLLLVMAKQSDTTKADLAFTNDSVVLFTRDGIERTPYVFTAPDQLIFKDSTKEQFTVQKISDSLITVTSKDSTVLYLKKI